MAGFKDLSLVAMFDELCRCSRVLYDGSAEIKFHEFVGEVDKQQRRWLTARDDCQRKHSQLVESNSTVTRLESHIKQAQNLLDLEQKRRQAVEHDLSVMVDRFAALRDLVLNEPDGVANDDTRQKVLQWSQPIATESGARRRNSSRGRLGTISESVGSLLSVDDFTVDYTEEDVDCSRLRSARAVQRGRGVKRMSDSADTEEDDGTGATRAKRRSRNSKRRNRQSTPSACRRARTSGDAVEAKAEDVELDGASSGADGGVVATTTLVVPETGPIRATSEVRTRSGSRSPRRRSATTPAKLHDRSFSEPPPTQRTPVIVTHQPGTPVRGCLVHRASSSALRTWWRRPPVVTSAPHPHLDRLAFSDARPKRSTLSRGYLGGSSWDVRQTPSAAGRQLYQPAGTPFSPALRHFGSAGKGIGTGGVGVGGPMHAFYEKTIIKPEPCQPCGKRINFGKSSLRCRDCRAICHPQCRDQVPVPCVPLTLTPTTRSGAPRQLADYVPPRGLMVPALVQHCVHQLEQRAMADVGLYRIPGSALEVKELKAKFLRGKGVPRLDNIESHVICCCIKDFLRSLIEPVIPRSLWHDFIRAACDDDEPALYQAVSSLAKPNRDTLAFLMLHLQRVASVRENNMNQQNLACVLGPTLVGYSAQNINTDGMLSESCQQKKLLECLMDLPSDYWTRLVESGLQDSNYSGVGVVGGTPVSSDAVQPLRATSSHRQRHLSYR